MTPRQRECLNAIERLTVDGVSPSYEQLADALGLVSKGNIHRLVHALHERGLVEIRPGRMRTVRIIDGDAEAVPFTALADAAVCHFRNHEGQVSADTMRAELVRAFRAYRVQFQGAA